MSEEEIQEEEIVPHVSLAELRQKKTFDSELHDTMTLDAFMELTGQTEADINKVPYFRDKSGCFVLDKQTGAAFLVSMMEE